VSACPVPDLIVSTGSCLVAGAIQLRPGPSAAEANARTPIRLLGEAVHAKPKLAVRAATLDHQVPKLRKPLFKHT
jgi:hypothetical protein